MSVEFEVQTGVQSDLERNRGGLIGRLAATLGGDKNPDGDEALGMLRNRIQDRTQLRLHADEAAKEMQTGQAEAEEL